MAHVTYTQACEQLANADIRLVFSDVDGTLTVGDHQAPTVAGRRWSHVLETYPVCLVSARNVPSLDHFARALSLYGPVVAFSGALVVDEHRRVLSSTTFDAQVALQVKTAIESACSGVVVATYSFDEWAVDCRDNPYVRYEELCVQYQAIEEPHPEQHFAEQGVHKLLVMGDHGSSAVVIAQVAPLFPELRFVASSDYLCEIMVQGVGKAAAISLLLDHVGCEPCNGIAFGDGHNDIDMLSSLSYSFAMANATPETMQAAWCQLPWSNEEFGVFRALNDLLQ